MSASNGVVADPIHDYVRFTAIEKLVLDQPVLQRLRSIAQNGLSDRVFPSVRTTRFEHSLGAMHLASSYFGWSLANSHDTVRDQLVAGLVEVATSAASSGAGAADIPGKSDFFDDRQVLIGIGLLRGKIVVDQEPWIALVEQALRLAALLHDIGHLPFSHDFEYALKLWKRRSQGDAIERCPTLFAPGPKAIHERVGDGVAASMIQVLRNLEPPGHSVPVLETIFTLARRILDAPTAYASTNQAEATLIWLHRLIAGEIDVDRSDYLLRDGRAHGFDFVTFDVRRLFEHMTVIDRRAQPIDGTYQFEVAVLDHARSAVESLLLSRYRLYQFGIRHHKVAQLGAALQHCIADWLGTPDDSMSSFLDMVEALAKGPSSGELASSETLFAFAAMDDTWLASQLRQRSAADPADPWLDLVCWRSAGAQRGGAASGRVRSVWKRPDSESARSLRELNEKVERFVQDAGKWQTFLNEMRDKGTIVVVQPFTPFEREAASDDAVLCYVRRDGTDPVPINLRSPLVDAMNEAWKADTRVQVFTIDDKLDGESFRQQLVEAMKHD